MRWLAFVVLCSGCSLVYNVDDLRARDGGGTDSGADADGGADADVGTDADAAADGDVGSDATIDAGPPCDESTLPRPRALAEGDGMSVVVSFATTSEDEAQYSVTGWPGVLLADISLPAMSDNTTLDLPSGVAVFQPPLTFSDDEGCETTLEFPYYSAELFLDGDVQGTSFVPGTSMDVADDGTVVFTTNTFDSGDAFDDIARWAPDSSVSLAATSPAGIQGLTAARISDDGRLVTYWQANDASGNLGVFQYVFDGAGAGSFVMDTGSVTSDVRNETPDTYHFVMRQFPFDGTDVLHHGELASTTLSGGGPLALNSLGVPGRSPHLRLSGGPDLTFIETTGSGVPSAVRTIRDLPAMGAPVDVPGCTIDASSGLSAAGDTSVAFVGTCGGVGPRLHVRTDDTGVDFSFSTDTTVGGLLGADADLATFLVRDGNNRYVIRDEAGTFEARNLNKDLVTIGGTFLDVAAISPNGEWVALSLADPSDPSERQRFRVARVRVRPAMP